MRDYWQERLNGSRKTLTKTEASAMACWVTKLESPETIEEGVKLAVSHKAKIQEHTDLLYDLTRGKLEVAPAAYGKLVAHLLEHTNNLSEECHYLAEIVQRLRTVSEHNVANTIATQALTRGCVNTSNW